ncbi:trans-sialidase [Trypanosoma rangeli]|uniref:Trans-sialidase n=1 Tax=Trypanosoma rangeli TaxID=5698 RepID=A0A3R7KSR3_TRYRA|nr:trans-sialidase [Trypanosoma rangeli]RNF00608.1 trans-sialidase [Trypanosoma rangeli]|eukprot:RNF00608.1 trans-sialidase [Trypanosoma rangeli]
MSEQRHMLNMSRHLFSSAMQLLFVLLICFASTAVHAKEKSTPKEVQLPKVVDLFWPCRTIVEARGRSQTRESFVSPSLASAGGVLVALAKSYASLPYPDQELVSPYYDDVVAGYIDSGENWSSFADEVNTNKWRAYNIFNAIIPKEDNAPMGHTYRPTTIAKGNKVFLLVGGYHQKYDPSSKKWIESSQDLDLLVGEATEYKVIQWGKPTSLLPQIKPSAKQPGLDEFVGGGGSGVVMEDGTFVFPVTARRTGESDTVSMIIYSKKGDKNWVLPQGMVHVKWRDPLIVEWEQGQLVMVARCDLFSKVFESRDMGATWTEAVGILTRVQPILLPNTSRTAERVGSLTTAIIAGKKVMLYTQQEILPEDPLQATALYLWVADNNRTFHVGPISMDTTPMPANTLLHSNDALHLFTREGQ